MKQDWCFTKNLGHGRTGCLLLIASLHSLESTLTAYAETSNRII